MMRAHYELEGWFRLEKGQCDEHGVPIESSKRVVAEFKNLILNQGLDYFGNITTGDTVIKAAQVGTGTTVPAESQTALATYLAGTTTVQTSVGGNAGSPFYYSYSRPTFRFSQGAAAGNLTEVGVGRQSATGALFSRALIMDGNGQNITNGDFNSGDTSWTKGTGWAINNSSGVYFDGLWSANFTGTGTATLLNSATPATVASGKVVTAECRVNLSATGKAGNIYLEFLDAGDVVIQTDSGNVVNTSAGWLKSTVTGTAPALATKVRVGFTATHTSGSGTLYADYFVWNLSQGEPTTITVLSNEFLDVTYELRQYPTLYDRNFGITIAGVAYTCVLRDSGVGGLPGGNGNTPNIALNNTASYNATGTAYTGALGAVTGAPASPVSPNPGSTTNSVGSYSNGNYYVDCTTTWSINAGNANIAAISVASPRGNWQCSFSPTIPKNNTKELVLVWRISWARRLI